MIEIAGQKTWVMVSSMALNDELKKLSSHLEPYRDLSRQKKIVNPERPLESATEVLETFRSVYRQIYGDNFRLCVFNWEDNEIMARLDRFLRIAKKVFV